MDTEDQTTSMKSAVRSITVYGLSVFVLLAPILGCDQKDREEAKPRHSKSAVVEKPDNERPIIPRPAVDYNKPIAVFGNNPTLPHTETIMGGQIKIIKSRNEDGLEWIMVSEETESAGGPGIASHEGRHYLKIGIAPATREKQRKWLNGDESALGVIYSIEPLGFVKKIDNLYVDIYRLEEGDRTPFREVKIVVDGEKETLFYREVVRDGRFAWYRQDEVRYFDAKEEVPGGFNPLYTLRVRGYMGFDYTEPSPRFNDKGISTLREYEKTHVRLRGLQYHSASEKLEALILLPNSALDMEEVKIVNYGDGSFKLYDARSTVDATRVQRVIGMDTTVVESLNAHSWNTRNEYLDPHILR